MWIQDNFGAVVDESAQPEYIGPALTFQIAIGFLITTVSIYIVPVFETQWVFGMLVIGLFVEIVAMN